MNRCIIYTDGSCWNGKYSDQTRSSSSVAILLDEDLNMIDYFISTANHGTSNKAEICAILNSIEHAHLKGFLEVDLYTDSKYSIKLFSNCTVDKNRYFYHKYIFLSQFVKIKMFHVNRNSKNKYNEIADELASIVRKQMDKFLIEHVSLPIYKRLDF